MAITTFIYPPAAGSASQVQYLLDGVATTVSKDTVTPANSRPLPVELTGTSGPINITAGDLNVHLSDTGANYDRTRIGDGTNQLSITASGEAKISATSLPLPTGAATEATLSTLGTETTLATLATEATLSAMSASVAQDATVAGLLTDTQLRATPVPVSGTVTASNPSVSATGAAVPASATMIGGSDGTNLKAIKVSATGVVSVDGSAVTQPVSGTFWQATQPVSGPLTDAELRATAVPVSQSGTWNITNVSGTVSLPTGAATESTLSTLNGKIPANLTVTSTRLLVDGSGVTQPVSIATLPTVGGRSKVLLYRNDYSSGNVTTSAYTQIAASTSAAINKIQIFDSSGQTMVIAVGAAASEVDQFYVFPGGVELELNIPASSRISIKAVSANATVGEISINFLS